MDVQLKELIDRINSDGVKSAEGKAKRIIAEAENQAALIIAKAREEADSLKKTARAEAEKSERSGKESLRQAGRDLVITVKTEIEDIFGKVLAAETGRILQDSLLSDAVAAAVRQLAASGPGEVEVLVPEKDMKSLQDGLVSRLGSEFAKGLEIRPFKGLDAGFRVSRKDGSAFYDFSGREIASMLGRYLNPRLAELLSE